jgi:hypothetical protein
LQRGDDAFERLLARLSLPAVGVALLVVLVWLVGVGAQVLAPSLAVRVEGTGRLELHTSCQKVDGADSHQELDTTEICAVHEFRQSGAIRMPGREVRRGRWPTRWRDLGLWTISILLMRAAALCEGSVSLHGVCGAGSEAYRLQGQPAAATRSSRSPPRGSFCPCSREEAPGGAPSPR